MYQKVVKPHDGVSTKDIFSSQLLVRNTKPATINDFYEQPDIFGRNDLQAVAQKYNANIVTALNYISSYDLSGRMSGSGSSVFTWINELVSNCDIDQMVANVPMNFSVRICSSLASHPLLEWDGW
jgi:4-diphosphocytidyl-2-C-methyl-D-erythritol kinase